MSSRLEVRKKRTLWDVCEAKGPCSPPSLPNRRGTLSAIFFSVEYWSKQPTNPYHRSPSLRWPCCRHTSVEASGVGWSDSDWSGSVLEASDWCWCLAIRSTTRGLASQATVLGR